jgi:MarR family transcriptional regulator for hemolysin
MATPHASANTMVWLLHDTARLWRERYDREFRARIPGMTLARAAVIVQLGRHEGLTEVRLAERLNVKPVTLVRLLNKLERLGWIERSPADGDRRALSLTPAVRGLLAEIRAIDCTIANEARAGIDADSRAKLIGMLAKLKENLTAGDAGPDQRNDYG